MANGNNNNKNNKQYLIIGIVALVLVVLSGGSITAASVFDFFGMNEPVYEVTQDVDWQDGEAEIPKADAVDEPQDSEEAEQTVVIRYEFRKQQYLDEHYEKHGIEMGFASAEEYLAAANAMIAHPDVLTKKEKEDNDDVYFLEATGEFAVVSTDGYLRTYYLADKDYFERQ